MDSISSNPYFNPTQFNRPGTPADSVNTASPSSHAKVQGSNAVPQANQTEPFANMFNDDELATLQSNLEQIAHNAERALKRFAAHS